MTSETTPKPRLADDEQRVARVKRIARTISKEMDIPHQKALDALARMAGTSHWGSLLAMPSPEDPHSVSHPGSDGIPPVRPIFMESTFLDDATVLAPIRQAVDAGRSLAICGATSTGKTILLSRLAIELDRKAHIHFVDAEDVVTGRDYDHPRWTSHEVGEWPAGLPDEQRAAYRRGVLQDAMNRATLAEPDALVLGEICTATALAAITTRQRVITTLHASTIDEAPDAIVDRILHGMRPRDAAERRERYRGLAEGKFCFVQVTRDPGTGRRAIGEVRI